MIRQQTSDDKSTILDSIRSIIETDGFQGFWKGLRASLILCSNPAITYGVFERLKGIWIRRNEGKPLNSGQIFIIGALSKALATVVTCEFFLCFSADRSDSLQQRMKIPTSWPKCACNGNPQSYKPRIYQSLLRTRSATRQLGTFYEKCTKRKASRDCTRVCWLKF